MEFSQIDLDQIYLNQCLGIIKEQKNEQENFQRIPDQLIKKATEIENLVQKTRNFSRRKRKKRKLPKNVYSQICKHLKYLVFSMIQNREQEFKIIKFFYQEMPQNKKTIQQLLRDKQLREQICVIFKQRLIEKRMNELHRKACSQQIQFNINKIQQFRIKFEKILEQNLEEVKPQKKLNIRCHKNLGMGKIITRSQKPKIENQSISDWVGSNQQLQNVEMQIMAQQKHKQNQRSHKI